MELLFGLPTLSDGLKLITVVELDAFGYSRVLEKPWPFVVPTHVPSSYINKSAWLIL